MINGKKLVALICIIFCCTSLSSCTQEYSSTKEEDYYLYLGEVCDAKLYMPNLEKLGEYEFVLATRKTPNDCFFRTTDSIALIVQYNSGNFELAINELEENYDFMNSALDNYKDIYASVDGYDFRVDSNSMFKTTEYPSKNQVSSPKHSLIIGVNTNESKIAYLFYWDMDVNVISELDEFIADNFVLE